MIRQLKILVVVLYLEKVVGNVTPGRKVEVMVHCVLDKRQ